MHVAPPFANAPIPYVGSMHRALVYFGYDGDTVFPLVDLPFGGMWSNPEKGLRLIGAEGRPFNAPELNASDPAIRASAQASRDRVRVLTDQKIVYVQSFKPATDDKYGRWLLCVWIPLDLSGIGLGDAAVTKWVYNDTDDTAGELCFDLASQLVHENLGVWYEVAP